jgi:general stress protein YciG
MAKTRKEYAQEFARKGGKARAKALTPEQRKEIARKAAVTRWSKKRGQK